MLIEEKFAKILQHHAELQDALNQPIEDTKKYAALSKEYADMGEIVALIKAYQDFIHQKNDIEQMLAESDDLEMVALAKEEMQSLKTQTETLIDQIKVLLIPKDVDDERNAILEIRAGTGGDEAGLFAGDLLRMYQRYADLHRWKFEVLNLSETGLGSVKEVSALISGNSVFARLKFESGVHRVQRVPETESSGRIHTSTATVAVLPEVEDIDVEINEKDLKIDVFRASGAGGQHVNTTDSAVRITHLPTGLVVSQQDERSQHKNKAKAMKILRAHLYEEQKRQRDSERASSRKQQVGTGDRSERIRTYNFPQGRITDHRINLTVYKLQSVLEGESLDDIIDPLTMHDQATKLAEDSIEQLRH